VEYACYLICFRFTAQFSLWLAGWFDSRLNRENRGRNARRVRGAIVLLIIALPVWVGASVFDGYTSQGPYGAMIDT